MEGGGRAGAKRGKGEGMTRERVDVYKSYVAIAIVALQATTIDSE